MNRSFFFLLFFFGRPVYVHAGDRPFWVVALTSIGTGGGGGAQNRKKYLRAAKVYSDTLLFCVRIAKLRFLKVGVCVYVCVRACVCVCFGGEKVWRLQMNSNFDGKGGVCIVYMYERQKVGRLSV